MAEPIIIFDAQGLPQLVGATNPLPTSGAAPTATNSSLKIEDAVHVTGDAGAFILGVRNDGAATVLTSASGDYSPVAVDAVGAVFVRTVPAVTPTVSVRTMVAVTAQTLQVANVNRRSLAIFNDTTAPLNVRLGAGASATSLTHRLAIGGYWEVPEGYTGLVDGFATGTGSGSVYVTEVA